MKPKVLIFRTAGINCDRETEFAFQEAGADTQLLHINLVKKKRALSSYQILCIPGGFSYGDDLVAGKIFSLELALWFKDELVRFLDKAGLILGICNGFQVLAKTGILPDRDFSQKVTLTVNDSARFEDRWTYLKISSNNTAAHTIWFQGLPEIINLPVAHMEGKFYAEEAILDRIEGNRQIALRYVDTAGKSGGYPYNPNGSLSDIAGITDTSGKVLGLMPHPERCIFRHHHPLWHQQQLEPWGLVVFKNAVNYFK